MPGMTSLLSLLTLILYAMLLLFILRRHYVTLCFRTRGQRATSHIVHGFIAGCARGVGFRTAPVGFCLLLYFGLLPITPRSTLSFKFLPRNTYGLHVKYKKLPVGHVFNAQYSYTIYTPMISMLSVSRSFEVIYS